MQLELSLILWALVNIIKENRFSSENHDAYHMLDSCGSSDNLRHIIIGIDGTRTSPKIIRLGREHSFEHRQPNPRGVRNNQPSSENAQGRVPATDD